jgi:uncharacterized membrane protein
MKTLIALAAVLALAQAPPLTKAEQLQDAARKGDAATVKKLLDEGVDVNTKFRYNATALFYACDHGHVEVVKVLLDHGADMTVKDTFYGFTPLMLATGPAQKKTPAHTEIAKLLIAKGAPGKEQALTSGVQSNDPALVKAVLDSGGLSAATLSDALETATLRKKADVIPVLEQAGAKPFADFKMDAAQLEKFAGKYKNADFTTVIAVEGGRLTFASATAPANRSFLAPKDETTFRAIGMAGTVFIFKMDGGKVISFAITPVQGNPNVYTRIEDK